MLKQVGSIVRGLIASEDGVRKQAILPVAWVGAVMMAAAVVLMPEKGTGGHLLGGLALQQSPFLLVQG